MSTTEQKALAEVIAGQSEIFSLSLAPGSEMQMWHKRNAIELHRLSAENEALLTRLASNSEAMDLATAEIARLRAQVEALTKPASRWNWISDLMQVHWSEGKFTSLVRIVSEEWRDAINASVDRMMAGDLPDAGTPPQNQAIQAAQERWTHDCPAIHVAAVASWSDKCRHCGAERPAPSAPQALTRPAVPEPSKGDDACAWSVWWNHHRAIYTTTRQSALAAWDAAIERERTRLAAAPQPEVEAETIRNDAEIVQQTEDLARALLSWAHNCELPADIQIRNDRNPRAKSCWAMACSIQELLTATDPENSVAELDGAPEAAQKGGA